MLTVAKKKEPKRKGRPFIEIDLETLEKLGTMHATYEEVAAWFSCTKRTIINRMKDEAFLFAFENGKLKGNLNLKRLSVRHAEGQGSSAVNMTIYLRKQWFGETDHPPPTTMIQHNNTLALTHASESDLRALESILARIADASASQGRIGEEGGSPAA